MSNWLNIQVSHFKNQRDHTGERRTAGEILRTEFARDLDSIIELRNLDPSLADYEERKRSIKANLQAWTPAALLTNRRAGEWKVIHHSGLLGIDFDYGAIKDYDIDELKRAVFSLPFVAFCGLSCSGNGFYSLLLISEPERLADYAEHCFKVFADYGIPPDTSKGRRANDLRFVSYDANMLIRENPEPLKVTFAPKPKITRNNDYRPKAGSFDPLIKSLLEELNQAQVGQRWSTVQKVAYTIGGTGNQNALYEMKEVIKNNPAFNGQEDKYFKCADDCYNDGTGKPLK